MNSHVLASVIITVMVGNVFSQQQPLANNGTQPGPQQTAQQAIIASQLASLLSNNAAALALLQTPDVAASFVGLFDNLNTTGNDTGLLDSLSTTSLVTLLFESLSLTVLNNNRVSDACQTDIIIFIEELIRGNPWALRMFDATGKPGSDLADGLTKFVGSYEECVAVNAVSYTQDSNGNTRERGSFDGKYCSLVFPIPNIPPDLVLYGFGYLQLGLCLPNTCNNEDVEKLATILERALFNQTVPLVPTSHCVEEREEVGSDFIVAVGILSILGCFVLAGTIYDVIVIQQRECSLDKTITSGGSRSEVMSKTIDAERNSGLEEVKPGLKESSKDNKAIKTTTHKIERSSVDTIMQTFSIYTNGKRMLNTKQEGNLGSINGIRFLSLGWIILGHSIIYSSKFGANYFSYLSKEVPKWTTIPLEYSDVSVDSFFAISGLLLSYLTLKQLKKVGGPKKMNWFIFYFHRYWRLTPPYMLVLMIGTVVMPYTLNGPFWDKDDFPFMKKCRQDWWANLLYINNFYHAKNGVMCMEWSWYLANDMQFFVISPILIITLFHLAPAGFTLCGVLMVCTWSVAGWIAYKNEYPAQMYAPFVVDAPETDEDYFRNLYAPSYTRMGSYIIGVMTGYLLYRWKCKCRIPKIVNLAGWFVCVSLTNVILYSRFINNQEDLFSGVGSAVFQAVHRTAWAIAVCWIVFACGTGNGGWINEFLSWKAFIPLGRMTYCAYLIHPLVIFAFSTSRMVLTYYTNYEVAYLFLSNITLTFGFAFIASLVLELPMMGLEKILLSKLRRRS